ncbi:poly-beta-hydroxybutyrate-responsive repressor [Modestobacter sp. DSM 44400]|uniref:PadR family transcriptional regulator n=1 Tax=Modestobacter sp. DSM 44400 TaxID=1550230 RepID=UPI00089912F3|nr:PadR family transcriptional regulator [Modestobacter sp. DSM 44400]SDY56983.1 poly-beta-hydroxybutyrate-responsive repressor [Modestobacter sp. DSM 44400]
MTARREENAVGLPRNYLRPCLLLLLAEGTAHGYELLEQMSTLGIDRVDPGGLYRCLRAMDEDGLVRSAWEPSTSGPARRTYELTDEGRQWLHVAAGSLAEVVRTLDRYHARYAEIAERHEPVR